MLREREVRQADFQYAETLATSKGECDVYRCAGTPGVELRVFLTAEPGAAVDESVQFASVEFTDPSGSALVVVSEGDIPMDLDEAHALAWSFLEEDAERSYGYSIGRAPMSCPEGIDDRDLSLSL